jgi:hypothetical protein
MTPTFVIRGRRRPEDESMSPSPTSTIICFLKVHIDSSRQIKAAVQ